MHGDARIEGYHYCMPLETLLALNYSSFILTVGIIGVNSHARGMYGNSHSQGTSVLLEIPTMHKLVKYFQSLYQTVNSLCQCSSKQCCAIAVYAVCYSVINPSGYKTLGTLSSLASNRNTLYNVMGVKRHIMPVDLPEVRVSLELR